MKSFMLGMLICIIFFGANAASNQTAVGSEQSNSVYLFDAEFDMYLDATLTDDGEEQDDESNVKDPVKGEDGIESKVKPLFGEDGLTAD